MLNVHCNSTCGRELLSWNQPALLPFVEIREMGGFFVCLCFCFCFEHRIYMTKGKEGDLDPKRKLKNIMAEKLREESKWSSDLEIHYLAKITTGERPLVTGIFQRSTKVSQRAKNHLSKRLSPEGLW